VLSPPEAPAPGRSPRSRSSSVHHRPEYLPAIEAARVALFGDHKPADTLVGMEALARPEYLIEVDAIAVIDAG
jgi:enamine deaminase RidA (YjgF/YER057c/UK114 family)